MTKKQERGTCDRCGREYVAKNYHVHINSPECVSEVNSKAALADGYIMHHNFYNAGHLSRVEWAKPFLKQYMTGVGMQGYKKKLENRWWALKWWLPIAYLTKSMSEAKRAEAMIQVQQWYEAGEIEKIDNMVGLLELAKDTL